MHHSAGTGLGLSVCKALIQAMGGQLQIENIVMEFKLRSKFSFLPIENE